MWLKVERLVSIHVAVVKEMQTNLREFLSEPEVEDNWLDASPDDMEKIRDLVQEDLVKPTANLADLMYKSVEIRDSRHSLQLNTSMWRLSWVSRSRAFIPKLGETSCLIVLYLLKEAMLTPIITQITFVFLPLTFISSFFGFVDLRLCYNSKIILITG